LRPQRNDFTGSHAYVACEFTHCLLSVRLCDVQQGLVSLIDLLEALLSLGIFIDIGVVFEGQTAERLPDLLIRGVLLQA